MREALARAMAALQVSPDPTATVAGSFSGAAVVPVIAGDGTAAVLKVTVAGAGTARRAAEREIRFYRELRPRVAVSTPRLLGHRKDEDAVAILLTRHPGHRPAPAWSDEDWLRLAEDLAELHQTPVSDGRGWSRGVGSALVPETPDLTGAQAFWTWPGEAALLEAVVRRTGALREAISRPDPCFLHGDCHTDNLLLHGDRLVWVDWQSAGVGNPAGELAFPSVRATPSGAAPPVSAMVQGYARRRGLDPDPLQRAVLASELVIFLLHWPPYAAYHDDLGVGRVHRRLQGLAHAWLAAS